MSVNRHRPHVLIIPEDDANRQLANGFVQHHSVVTRVVAVMPPAGGWTHVLSEFEEVYIQYLRTYPDAYVVMLIDFDDDETRRPFCEQKIPDDLKPRVFLVGSKQDPQALKRAVGGSLERIGTKLADECHRGEYALWSNEHFGHNDSERERLAESAQSFLFQDD